MRSNIAFRDNHVKIESRFAIIQKQTAQHLSMPRRVYKPRSCPVMPGLVPGIHVFDGIKE